jgi:hypothetical protein
VRWMTPHSVPKPTVLAVYGAVGGLLAAAVVEGFRCVTLNKNKASEPSGPQAACVTLECA